MARTQYGNAPTWSRMLRLPLGNRGELTAELTASEECILTLRHITGPEDATLSDAVMPPAISSLFDKAEQELSEFLLGERHTFTVPYHVTGTPFQQRVWQEIARVPYGEVISYKELARRAGNPRAVRAAASACGANRVPFWIPCHRIVATDGVGGFGWGMPLKYYLLELEGITHYRHAA